MNFPASTWLAVLSIPWKRRRARRQRRDELLGEMIELDNSITGMRDDLRREGRQRRAYRRGR